MGKNKAALLDFYKKQLGSFGIGVNENADAVSANLDQLVLKYVSYDDDEITELPIGVNSIPIYMCTDALCANESDERFLFHPLCENPLASESIILSRLKSTIRFNLGAVIHHVASAIAVVAADPDKQKGLSKAASAVLKEVGPCSAKASGLILKIMNVDTDSKIPAILSAHIHRKHEDYTSRRVTIVKSQLLNDENYDDDKMTIMGVKIVTKKDYLAIRNILKVVLEPFQGGYISDSEEAPSYHSMMRAYAGVQQHLLSLVKLFKRHCKFSKEMLEWTPIDEWITMMDDSKIMRVFRTVQPKLRGNVGNTKNNDESKSRKKDLMGGNSSRAVGDTEVQPIDLRAKANGPAPQQPVQQQPQLPEKMTMADFRNQHQPQTAIQQPQIQRHVPQQVTHQPTDGLLTMAQLRAMNPQSQFQHQQPPPQQHRQQQALGNYINNKINTASFHGGVPGRRNRFE